MPMIKVKLLIAAAAVWAVGMVVPADAQFYEVPAGFIEGISDNGVASGSEDGTGQYFRWTIDGGVEQIGGVSPGSGVGGQGKISNDGRYISGTTLNVAEGYHEMSRYDSDTGTWTGFGMIPGIGQQIDAEVSSGWGISGDGGSVVGLGWTTQGTADTHAYQWTDGVGPIDLGSATVGESARANATNFDGSVVAGWQDGNGRQGAVWVNGVQELISDGGNPAQEAQDVSGDGTWVTGLGIGGFFDPGFAYRYNTVTNVHESLPNLDVGAESRMAGAAITDDGATVVGGTWGVGPATFGNAIIWREGIGTIRMDDYLDSLGIARPDGFTMSFASAVSSDSNWIAGWGGFGSPNWVVHIPEPGTSALVMLGLAGLALLRRR